MIPFLLQRRATVGRSQRKCVPQYMTRKSSKNLIILCKLVRGYIQGLLDNDLHSVADPGTGAFLTSGSEIRIRDENLDPDLE
jgi:hypothetical protein